MTLKPKILYVQHAAALGGSVISLRELIIDAIARGYDCTVVCTNPAIAEIYTAIGASVEIFSIEPLNHNTSYHYRFTPFDLMRLVRIAWRKRKSFSLLGRFIQQLKPDLVHLNSSTLVMYVPFVRKLNVPVILHIRENVSHGYFGLRKNIIRKIANTASHIFFISEFEYEILGTEASKSTVVYNYVHESSFKAGVETGAIQNAGKFRIATLGGMFKLKGGKILLEALLNADARVELFVVGSDDPRTNAKDLTRIEGAAYTEAIVRLLDDRRLESRVSFAGKVTNPAMMIASSNAIVFWTDGPHFPRPVFEAWLLRCPVIYFNPGFKNDKINSETVFAVTGPTVQELTSAFNAVQTSGQITEAVRKKTYQIAHSCFTEHNFQRIDGVYQKVLTAAHH